MIYYYNYKTENFTCPACGWNGPGAELSMGDSFSYGFEYHCPKCSERIPGLIPFPSHAEVLENGSAADKKQVSLINQFQEKYQASLLKDISQLPNLPPGELTFILREEWAEDEASDENFIVISESDKIIWKEMMAYEYYERFIKLGKLLKQKYGDAMLDLVPDVKSCYLHGDSISASDMVEAFRDTLRKK